MKKGYFRKQLEKEFGKTKNSQNENLNSNKKDINKINGIENNFQKDNIGNERMLICLRHSEGKEIALQQTAVFCNKRIKDKVKYAQEFNAGERFGFMRFGGYTDIFLPEKTEPQVCVGQTMIAGETIMADIKSDAPRIEGEIR